jgi:hypothetical protein
MGFMDLFVGAIILSIGFKLLLAWRDDLSYSRKSSQPDDFASEKSMAEG